MDREVTIFPQVATDTMRRIKPTLVQPHPQLFELKPRSRTLDVAVIIVVGRATSSALSRNVDKSGNGAKRSYFPQRNEG